MKLRFTIDTAQLERLAQDHAMTDPELLDDDLPDAVDKLVTRYLDALEPLSQDGGLVIEVDTDAGTARIVRQVEVIR